MWNNRDFDELKMFCEFVEEYGLEELFNGVNVDAATMEAIEDYFYFYRVCDNDRFVRYFRRIANLYLGQYLQYLRIETTEFDPMVADYMERELKRVASVIGSDTGKNTGTRTNSSSGSSTDATTNGGTVKTVVDGTNKTTHDTKDTTTASDSDKTTTEGTNLETRNLSGTRDVTVNDDTTTNTEVEKEETLTHGTKVSATGESGHRAMHSELPPTGITANEGGTFPGEDGFNWKYPTTQDENRDNSESVTDTTGTETTEGTDKGKTVVDGSVVTDEDTTDTGTVNTATNTETKHSKSGNSETVKTGTDTTDTDSETTVTDSRTVNVTGTSSAQSSESNESETEHNTTTDTDARDRERYSGRHASPQELLDVARRYILKTNAFEWYCGKLSACFMTVLD